MDEKSGTCSRLSEKEASLTQTQRRYLSLFREFGTVGQAAKKAGVHRSTVVESLSGIAKKFGVENYEALIDRSLFVANVAGSVSKKKKTISLVKQIVQIVELQDFRCALSGIELDPENSNLDHKHPVSLGGTDEIENLQWLDANVNRAKGNMSNDDFILMCKRVAAWNR